MTRRHLAVCAERPITDRQFEILAFLVAFVGAKRGFAPTIREVGEHFAIKSSNGVADLLARLEAKGFVRRAGEKRARTLTIVRVKYEAELAARKRAKGAAA